MKNDYMARLSRWARWMLPWQEAEDVIADYRDIVGVPPRPEEELLRDLGRPRDAVKALARPWQYRTWVAVFAVMVLCILALITDPLFVPAAFWVPFLPFHRIDILFCCFLFVLGVMAALSWFRRQGQKTEQFPKAASLLLAVLLIFSGSVVLFYWLALGDPDAIVKMWEESMPAWFPCAYEGPFYLVSYVTCYGCPLIVLIGIYSLIKARTGDRRWAAVYVLAMTVLLILRMFLEFVRATDTSIAGTETAYRQLMLRCAVAAAAGLAGTGVALC